MNTGGDFDGGESLKRVPEHTSDEREVSDPKGAQSNSVTLQDSGYSSKDILNGKQSYRISFAHYNINSMYMCLVCIIKKYHLSP